MSYNTATTQTTADITLELIELPSNVVFIAGKLYYIIL